MKKARLTRARTAGAEAPRGSGEPASNIENEALSGSEALWRRRL
jgi:hypothetical protein